MSNVVPALSVLFAVLAAAVPWGLPADATFILPLVVGMMVFCWGVIPDADLSPVAAMLLGLLTDITSGGPLGFWALMMLVAATAGGRSRPFASEEDLGVLWLIWAALAVALSCLGWLLASLYFLRWIDWWPIAFGAATSVVLFPLVLHGLLWIKHGRISPARKAIFRGWT
jgi:rod shape-determining protein MreD